jgi:Flp pilus assembly protein TadD
MVILVPFLRNGSPATVCALAGVLALSACANLEQHAPEQTHPAKAGHAAAARAGPAADAARVPSKAAAVLAEVRQVRAAGDKRRALALLEKAAAQYPDDRAVAGERGLLALELGQVSRAKQELEKALDPDAPDWRLHSGLGAALSASGRQQEAQLQFAKALALAPEHPAVLNNLALSYALDGRPEEAEKLLRRASAGSSAESARAKQNLALILGLNGRLEEARQVAQTMLPSDQAAANVSYLEQQTAADTTPSETAPRPVKSAQSAAGEAPAYNLGGPID